MQSHTTDSQATPRSLLNVAIVIARHGWSILLFRHHGQGLEKVRTRHAEVLLAAALLVVIVTTYFAPGLNRGQSAAFAGAWFIMLSMTVRVFGQRALAGWACLYMLTEPTSLLIRYLPHGHVLDLAASAWTVLAAVLFMTRCHGNQIEAGK